MACLTTLEQDTIKKVWVGTSVRTGETRTFNTIDDYKQYTKNLEEKGTYCPDITPIFNTEYVKGRTTQESGFMEFAPRDSVTQAKYDALSDTWEGASSSEAAVARGDYSLDSAEATRQELRAAGRVPPKETPAPASNYSCSIQ
jgi:hypothetical protein